MLKKKVSKVSLFIGPLPPPLGGVAIINLSFQKLNFANLSNLAFNTSKSQLREKPVKPLNFTSFYWNFKLFFDLIQLVKKERPIIANVFVTSGKSIIRDLVFLFILKIYHTPTITHFHSKTHGEFALGTKRLKIFGYLLSILSSKVLLLSEHHKTYFQNYITKTKCEVIENFVDYSDFENNIDFKLDEFLYVGRLSKEKGFYDLLDAVKILKSLKIMIKINVIGVASSEDEEKILNNIVKRHEIEEYFIFHNALFGKKKYELFKKCSCLIFPSRFENSPVVIKEAIAAKQALVVSDIEANKVILSNHNNHLIFQVGNSSSLAEKLIEIIQNPHLTKELCLNSSKINQYDSVFAQAKLSNIIDEIINENS